MIKMASTLCKVLIIDDDASCAEELCLLLSASGFTAENEICAADGIRHFLRDPSVRVVVSDIRMPDFDGVRLLDQIRSSGGRGLDATVILVTGQPDLHTTIDALNLGASAMLMKPLDPVEIVSAVSKAIDIQMELIGFDQSRKIS
jgi:DNA-binding NtrC family response regulator